MTGLTGLGMAVADGDGRPGTLWVEEVAASSGRDRPFRAWGVFKKDGHEPRAFGPLRVTAQGGQGMAGLCPGLGNDAPLGLGPAASGIEEARMNRMNKIGDGDEPSPHRQAEIPALQRAALAGGPD